MLKSICFTCCVDAAETCFYKHLLKYKYYVLNAIYYILRDPKSRLGSTQPGRIQPVTLGGGVISVKFGSEVSLRIHYGKKDKVYFTTLLWQNNGRQNGFISWMLFSKLHKSLGDKIMF